MNYSWRDYLRFAVFVVGQVISVLIGLFASLVTLGQFQIGVIALAVLQIPLAFVPPVRGEDESWKQRLWWVITWALLGISALYAFVTIVLERYLIFGQLGYWAAFLIALWAVVGYWISAPTRVRFVLGHTAVAIFGVTLAVVSLVYRVPFTLSGESIECEDTTYEIVEYQGFKGEFSYAYFQQTGFPGIFARPDWQSVGLECLEAGLQDDVLRGQNVYRSVGSQSDATSVAFANTISPNDILELQEEFDLLYRSEDIFVTLSLYPSPRNRSQQAVVAIENPPSERAFREFVTANVSEDTYDPMNAPIVNGITLEAREGSYDSDTLLALIDVRFDDAADFGELDPWYWRSGVRGYSFEGTPDHAMVDTVYREALFEFEAMYYDEFLKINEFVGSIFEFRYDTEYSYEIHFAVDRPFEWRDMSVQGGMTTFYTQAEFEDQYRAVVRRKAEKEWFIDPRPEELDPYQNHLHRYVLYPDAGGDVADRFDYLFGQPVDVSSSQKAEWGRELAELGLDRESIQARTQEVIQRGGDE